MTPRPTLAVRPGALIDEATELLAVLVTPSGLDAEALNGLDAALDGHLRTLAKAEGFEGKAGERFVLHTMGKLPAQRVALVGIGELPSRRAAEALRTAGALAARCGQSAQCDAMTLAVAETLDDIDDDARDALALMGAALGAYRYDAQRSSEPAPNLSAITLLGANTATGDRTQALANAVYLARDLGNDPPNVLVPEVMASKAAAIARARGLEVEIFEPDELVKRGMNLLYAVGKGSVNGPRLIRLTYTPKGASRGRIALVGKGVTFDTGGYSLKPPKSLLNMHLDMGGAAAVLGAADAIGALGCQWTVDFFVAAAENSISERAYRPMDVIKGYGGKTVEITNTDAEGRLCLADALAYAIEREPDHVVNLATLTGACLVALGEDTAAAFGTDDALRDAIVSVGDGVGESFWGMPLNESLRSKLKSPVADTRNSATSPWGGAITAALFLKLWVGDASWVHLDIAGPGMGDSDTTLSTAGGTGFGVVTLVALLDALGA